MVLLVISQHVKHLLEHLQAVQPVQTVQTVHSHMQYIHASSTFMHAVRLYMQCSHMCTHIVQALHAVQVMQATSSARTVCLLLYNARQAQHTTAASIYVKRKKQSKCKSSKQGKGAKQKTQIRIIDKHRKAHLEPCVPVEQSFVLRTAKKGRRTRSKLPTWNRALRTSTRVCSSK